MEPTGPTLSLAPIPVPAQASLPFFLLGLTSLHPPYYSALLSVLLLPTPGIFVLRTRVKFTCPYPFFWCELY